MNTTLCENYLWTSWFFTEEKLLIQFCTCFSILHLFSFQKEFGWSLWINWYIWACAVTPNSCLLQGMLSRISYLILYVSIHRKPVALCKVYPCYFLSWADLNAVISSVCCGICCRFLWRSLFPSELINLLAFQ